MRSRWCTVITVRILTERIATKAMVNRRFSVFLNFLNECHGIVMAKAFHRTDFVLVRNAEVGVRDLHQLRGKGGADELCRLRGMFFGPPWLLFIVLSFRSARMALPLD